MVQFLVKEGSLRPILFVVCFVAEVVGLRIVVFRYPTGQRPHGVTVKDGWDRISMMGRGYYLLKAPYA